MAGCTHWLGSARGYGVAPEAHRGTATLRIDDGVVSRARSVIESITAFTNPGHRAAPENDAMKVVRCFGLLDG